MTPSRRVRLASLHALSIALARRPDWVALARRLAGPRGARGRLARLAVAFTFARRLRDRAGEPGDGLGALLALVGADRGPAVVLAALLMALGERVRLECTRGMAFVRVELDATDVACLPPHARLIAERGRVFLPLDPRHGRSPFGFLPEPERAVLARRGGPYLGLGGRGAEARLAAASCRTPAA